MSDKCHNLVSEHVSNYTSYFLLHPFHAPMMSKKMTFVEHFDVIDAIIKSLERVIDIVRNMQYKEILKLFQRAKE